jgi:hypothetical protein
LRSPDPRVVSLERPTGASATRYGWKKHYLPAVSTTDIL